MDILRDKVKKRYGQAIREGRGCCSGDGCALSFLPAESLYAPSFLGGVPSSLAGQSFGCGNPLEVADLKPGETVLDLGCGAGLDLMLASEAVGPGGRLIGVDMTDEMLDAARENLKGRNNILLVKGYLEDLPLEEESVDVVISNCVINLSPDKKKVLREAWRVLRPGGRLSVADTVFLRPVPSGLSGFLSGWCGCISGALSAEEYRTFLAEAGFVSIEIRPKKVYFAGEALLEMMFPDLQEEDRMKLKGALASASVTAEKPLA
ncbi:MAG: arsenite methyltransferase [Synergistaceae bacterium]|nr:arsenite methyltransferase [Synergistaceae bacterium]